MSGECSCHLCAPCSFCENNGPCEGCGEIFPNADLDAQGYCDACACARAEKAQAEYWAGLTPAQQDEAIRKAGT